MYILSLTVAGFFAYCFLSRRFLADENKELVEENEKQLTVILELSKEKQQFKDKLGTYDKQLNEVKERYHLLYLSNAVLSNKYNKICSENSTLHESIKIFESQNKRLDEWKRYLDVDTKVNEIMLNADRKLRDAKDKADRIESNARQRLDIANKEADGIIEEASIKASFIEKEAREILSQANQFAQKIRGDANRSANEIVQRGKDESYRIKQESDKKVNESRSLLLELNEKIANAHIEFHYRKTLPETYEKLKASHEDLKEKYRNSKDANNEARSKKNFSRFEKLILDYIEDTFKNVVSKMTPNNYAFSKEKVLKVIGKSRSFGFNWSPDFEDKYIDRLRDSYKHALRIEEYRLEQKRIKEQIREETRSSQKIVRLKKKEAEAIREREEAERARKEMQRAIANALAKANGEHTAHILEMEKELADKDTEIAAKQQEIDDNRRAISNAQLTKSGHVYVLSNIGAFGKGVFKIGMSRRTDPMERVWELSGASVPFPFDVHLMISCENAPELEKRLHRRFNASRINRVNLRKEFFRINIEDVRKEIIEFLGKDVDYIADPSVTSELAEQYWKSQQATLEDIEEIELLYEEAGIDIEANND